MKGGIASSLRIEPTIMYCMTIQYKDMLYVRQWSDARPTGRVRCWQAQCREPNTGLLKVQLASKTEHFAHLGILFIYDCSHSAWRIRIIWYRSGSWIWKKTLRIRIQTKLWYGPGSSQKRYGSGTHSVQYNVNILSRILLRNTQCCSSGSVPIKIIFRHRIFFIWIRPLKTSFAELQTHHYHFIC